MWSLIKLIVLIARVDIFFLIVRIFLFNQFFNWKFFCLVLKTVVNNYWRIPSASVLHSRYSGAISLFWCSRHVQTIILGIFGRGYSEYFLVRKPQKVYITIRVFLAVSLSGRVVLHDLLHLVPACTRHLLCIRGHFEHLLWLNDTHYDNFSVLSLWILKEICCYCVEYVRFCYFWSFVFRKVV